MDYRIFLGGPVLFIAGVLVGRFALVPTFAMPTGDLKRDAAGYTRENQKSGVPSNRVAPVFSGTSLASGRTGESDADRIGQLARQVRARSVARDARGAWAAFQSLLEMEAYGDLIELLEDPSINTRFSYDLKNCTHGGGGERLLWEGILQHERQLSKLTDTILLRKDRVDPATDFALLALDSRWCASDLSPESQIEIAQTILRNASETLNEETLALGYTVSGWLARLGSRDSFPLIERFIHSVPEDGYEALLAAVELGDAESLKCLFDACSDHQRGNMLNNLWRSQNEAARNLLREIARDPQYSELRGQALTNLVDDPVFRDEIFDRIQIASLEDAQYLIGYLARSCVQGMESGTEALRRILPQVDGDKRSVILIELAKAGDEQAKSALWDSLKAGERTPVTHDFISRLSREEIRTNLPIFASVVADPAKEVFVREVFADAVRRVDPGQSATLLLVGFDGLSSDDRHTIVCELRNSLRTHNLPEIRETLRRIALNDPSEEVREVAAEE